MSGHEFEATSQFGPTAFSMDSTNNQMSEEEAEEASAREKKTQQNKTRKKLLLSVEKRWMQLNSFYVALSVAVLFKLDDFSVKKCSYAGRKKCFCFTLLNLRKYS